jgi:hypothetical protein
LNDAGFDAGAAEIDAEGNRSAHEPRRFYDAMILNPSREKG